MITKQQVRDVINNVLNGKLPPLEGSPDRTATLRNIGIYLIANGYNTVPYYGLVEDYLNVRFCDLPDVITDIKLVSYLDILNAL
jgi:hypothetical protein